MVLTKVTKVTMLFVVQRPICKTHPRCIMVSSCSVLYLLSRDFSLLGQLLSFTDQLFQGQSCANLKWNSPPTIDNIIPKSHSLISITSQGPVAAEPPEQQSKSESLLFFEREKLNHLQNIFVSQWRFHLRCAKNFSGCFTPQNCEDGHLI